MEKKIVDILENSMKPEVLSILLMDRSSNNNIIWATDDYKSYGDGYLFNDSVDIEKITGDNGFIIKPRVEKDKEAKYQRAKDKAEVFTPAWVCNIQNNYADDFWFGKNRKRFNTSFEGGWEPNYYKIRFPEKQGKTWKDYVLNKCLEITCGEAPYITSRYDSVSGKYIPVKCRVGLLDRKLRVIGENLMTKEAWIRWAKKAVQSIYGFEWQGDNILLARENVLFTVIEHYFSIFGKELPDKDVLELAEIISWNIWQMDGIKYVIPNSCIEVESLQMSILGNKMEQCLGCKTDNPMLHTGIYSLIRDWETDETIKFVETFGEDNHGSKI